MREVVDPCAINVLFVVVKEEALTLKVIIVPVVAADEFVGFGDVYNSKVFSGLFLLIDLTLVDGVAVSDG